MNKKVEKVYKIEDKMKLKFRLKADDEFLLLYLLYLIYLL